MIVFLVFAVLRMLVFRPESPGTSNAREAVRVSHVIDGDTLDLQDGRRLRLLGIDAPELQREGQKAEPLSSESTEWLRARVEGASIQIRIDSAQKDRYGRVLAWIYDDAGHLINEQLLSEGLALLLDDYGLPAELEPQLRQAESEARLLKKGIWSLNRQTPKKSRKAKPASGQN